MAGNSQYPLCYYFSSSTSLNKIFLPWVCLRFFLQSGHNPDLKAQAFGLHQEMQHRKRLFSAALCCQHTFCWLVLNWSLFSKYRTEEYKGFSNTFLILMNTLRCCLNANNICKPLVRWGGEKKPQPKFKTHHCVSYGLSSFCLAKGNAVAQAPYFPVSVLLLSYTLTFRSQMREG